MADLAGHRLPVAHLPIYPSTHLLTPTGCSNLWEDRLSYSRAYYNRTPPEVKRVREHAYLLTDFHR